MSVVDNSCGRANCNAAWRVSHLPEVAHDANAILRGAAKTISEQVSQSNSGVGAYGPKKNNGNWDLNRKVCDQWKQDRMETYESLEQMDQVVRCEV